MWEIFFLTGIVFLSLGIFEFKKYKKQKFKEYTDTKKALQSLLPQKPKKEVSQQSVIKKKVIPLDLSSNTSNLRPTNNREEVELVPQNEGGSLTMHEHIPQHTSTIYEQDIEEKKRLWNEHWIVKKVKERFEKKQQNIEISTEHKEEQGSPPYTPTQEPQKSNVFTSLLEERDKKVQDVVEEKEQEEIKEISHAEKPIIPLNDTQEEKKQQKEEEEEKEFNPFDVFG